MLLPQSGSRISGYRFAHMGSSILRSGRLPLYSHGTPKPRKSFSAIKRRSPRFAESRLMPSVFRQKYEAILNAMRWGAEILKSNPEVEMLY
jgi:hypothetical protein